MCFGCLDFGESSDFGSTLLLKPKGFYFIINLDIYDFFFCLIIDVDVLSLEKFHVSCIKFDVLL